MVVIHTARGGRKSTGGRYSSSRTKRNAQVGSMPTHTSVGKNKVKVTRTMGGGSKARIAVVQEITVFNPKDKKHYKTVIKAVIENTASRHFIRQNIITKGAILDTEKGKAKVTSRPGQDGTVNAVLM